MKTRTIAPCRETHHECAKINFGFRPKEKYFSITIDAQTFGGCCDEIVLAVAPDLAPFVELHLSDGNGAPMHAIENGWYWLAGALGGAGEEFSALTNGHHTEEDCLKIFAEHCRISLDHASAIRSSCRDRLDRSAHGLQGYRVACKRAKARAIELMEAMRPRWKDEADLALKLLETL